ncbi:phosphoglycerate mutase-like protein [Mollisia scopiformis]|uniref:Phosphoglycerate mutase-like protein n=1 Tax=Mollisia scopiformis TaxID=149040 RepID=A0A194X9B3_MOLSC|nr:phosphoglycerate mutase-like protein [Mollisia scopiformis]KUJ16758.1 phosphoglycerate mutase-like protein [Mollisia scopiformis]
MYHIAFLGTIFAIFCATQAHQLKQKPLAQYISYSSVPGYFLQDNNSTNSSTFDFVATNFGLINQTYPTDAQFDPKNTKSQWERFANQVFRLNLVSPSNIEYKILFIGRHGEGYHNAAETFYGTPAWNCYWAQLDGNSTVTWFDAHLDANGVAQAQTVNNLWSRLIATQNIQTPQSYYVSPLTRCLQTANVSFSGLDLPASHPFVPEVKELLREGIDIHTCDSRSNLTYIKSLFPSYTIEPGFTEYDLLFRQSTSETPTAQGLRSKTLLDQIFSTDGETFISFTTHSGEASSLLSVLGHRSFSLSTGAVIPILVKAETLSGTAPVTTVLPYTSQVVCNAPPITSQATGTCVCSSGSTISTGLAKMR